MSLSRQSDQYGGRAGPWILGAVERWPPATGIERHAHTRHQIMFATRGVIHVDTADGSWILPATRAIWISGTTEHAFRARRSVDIVVLYVDPATPGCPPWQGCMVVDVSPLVRELISACAGLPATYAPQSAAGRLSQVLLEQLAALSQAPVELPEPKDPRAARVASILKCDPSDTRSVAQLALEAGASVRTIERLFATETRMSFGAWRIRHRMVVALEHLAHGESVGDVAFTVGYESASSFVAAFRQAFGTTPSRYFKVGR